MTLDPRLNPARPDVAAAHLQGQVEAAKFVTGQDRMVATSTAPMTAQADPEAGLTSQLLCGEVFTVYDIDDDTGLAWGQAKQDGYVGWIPNFMLEPVEAPTHHVTALMTHCYPEPDLKTRPFDMLPMLAAVTVVGQQGKWLELSTGGWVPGRHLSEDLPGGDWVAIAELFINTPYLWGGRTPSGIDCSGLIQIALQAVGQDCLRDSDMQQGALGQQIDPTAGLQRGDLAFWKGHVGVLVDDKTLLHANAFAMATVLEPFDLACDRIKAQGDGALTSMRRLTL